MFKAAYTFNRGDVLVVRDEDNEVKEYHYAMGSAYDAGGVGPDMVCIPFGSGVQVFPAFAYLEFTDADDEE